MKGLKLVALAALLCTLDANADENAVYMYGFQDSSCGTWAMSAADPLARAQYFSWMRGVITGHNLMVPWRRQIKADNQPSEATMALYIDKFCHENPLGSFQGAVIGLINELDPETKK